MTAGSRLDRMIARLGTQRAYLEYGAGLIAAVPGVVLEVGLGKGRTYSHLRLLLPDREIFAFDGQVHAPADCVPDADHLYIGDFRDTLAAAAARLAGRATLIHADFGSEDAERDAEQARWLGPLLDPLLVPGGAVISDRPLAAARWQPLAGPTTVGWRYHIAIVC